MSFLKEDLYGQVGGRPVELWSVKLNLWPYQTLPSTARLLPVTEVNKEVLKGETIYLWHHTTLLNVKSFWIIEELLLKMSYLPK